MLPRMAGAPARGHRAEPPPAWPTEAPVCHLAGSLVHQSRPPTQMGRLSTAHKGQGSRGGPAGGRQGAHIKAPQN